MLHFDTMMKRLVSQVVFYKHFFCLVLVFFNIVDIISGKKDPGVPNRFPFKEELLREAEKRKQKVSRMRLLFRF